MNSATTSKSRWAALPLATFLLTCGINAAPLGITNPSFEDDDVNDGQFVNGLATGWDTAGNVTGTQDFGAGTLPTATDGEQHGVVSFQEFGGSPTSLSQVTTHTISAGETYTLTVDVGQVGAFSGSEATIFLFGGTTGIGTPLSNTNGTAELAGIAPGSGAYLVDQTVSYTALASGDPFEGEQIGIGFLNSVGTQTLFDNVRLESGGGGPDVSPPEISILDPADDTTGVVTSMNLKATFSEPVTPGTGNITIKNLTDASDTVIAIDDTTQVSFVGSGVTIDPVADLLAGKDYAVQVAAGAIFDTTTNSFPGIIDTTTWNFSTDGTAPMSSSMGPTAGADNFSSNADLTLLFDEDVQVGTGNIEIFLADGTPVETIDVTSGAVTIDGAEVTIDISDLAGSTAYYVNIAAGAFQDLSGNSFGGILDTTTWAFTTSSVIVTTAMSGPNSPSTTDDELTYALDVSSSDLLHGIVGTGGSWNANGSSPDGLNDGDPGGDFDDVGNPAALNGAAWAKDGDGVSFREFELGTGSGSGYDITEIQSIAAWQGAGFSNQKYEVRVRLVGEASFPVTPLLTVEYQPFPTLPLNNGGSTKVNVTSATGLVAGGVEAIRFDVLDTTSNNGGGTVFREIDVFGAETGAGAALQLTIAENAGALDFAWNSLPGMQYDLVSSTDLSPGAGTWAIYDDGTMTYENIPATGMSTTLTGVMKVGADRFFAVVEEEIPPLFSEDFEGDDGGFTVATAAGTDWEHGAPDSGGVGGTVSAGNGGSANCWGTKLGDISGTTADAGYYADSTITCLRSAVIDLTGMAGAELMFAEAIDLEAGDTAVVHIIDDTSDTVIATAIYTATDSAPSTATWASAGPITIPPAALGQPVRIEWCFNGFGGDTDDYLGWYIDDVVVTETFP